MDCKQENSEKTKTYTSGINTASVYTDPYKYIPLPIIVNGYGVNLI